MHAHATSPHGVALFVRRSACTKVGFTLIELVIVVTVIGLLVGLVIPQLSSIRHRANITACMGNARNIGMAMLAKAVDNRGSLLAPMDKRVDYAFTARDGTPTSFHVDYPKRCGYAPEYFQYTSYGFYDDLRATYAMDQRVNRCPIDPTPFGGNHQKQQWAWADAGLLGKVESDPNYYSSYWPNFDLLFMVPRLSQLAAPSLTYLVLETTIPDAVQHDLGPSYYASIHGRGRNFHQGDSNSYQGLAAFADGHTEMWDWSRCGYMTSTGELTPNPTFAYVAPPLPGVGNYQNLRE